jgi:hypothetical protein
MRLIAVGLLAALTLPADTRVPPDRYLEHVKYLASEKLQGRYTGTKQLEEAARYIAREFKSAGLQPASPAGYFQRFSVTTRARLTPKNSLSYTLPAGTKTLKSSKEFIPFNFSSSAAASGHVVFAGYGITAREYDYDDYAGIDVKDKIVLILRHEPQEFDEKSRFAGKNATAHAQFDFKAINAKNHGAKAVILINTLFNKTNQEDKLEMFPRTAGPGDRGIPMVQMLAAEADAWFALAGKNLKQICEDIDKDLKPRSFAFPDTLKVNLNVEVQREVRTSLNVAGYLPGETDEYVVIGAHFDHLGFGEQFSLGTPGKTHYGADDNASGTAGVLELARWFGKQPKMKRGILFLAFSGEELGLLGSAHYVEHPLKPLNQAVAMINMDMIGRIRDRKLFLSGSGTGSSFKALIDELKPRYDFQLDLSEAAGYGSSDHTSFTTKRVPVLFFFSGLHGDYHKPSDTWDKIDAPNAAKMLDLVADVTLRLANNTGRPEYVRIEPPKPPAGSSSGGSGYGPYFGSIPDFAEVPNGVRFSDVRAGSPAEKAGLKGGDILIEFDGKPVKNLYDYTYALRSKQPGDEVLVKFLRDGKTIEAKVLLTRRQ